MGKVTIQDIAAILIEKNGLDKRQANAFASAMFALIQERLETDPQVKVKGLGTFKIIEVEARESISVHSGERVTISGHSKVTFTPDAIMKELVNKPFADFETVVLNDGVEFSDIQEESEEEVTEDSEPVVEALPVADSPGPSEESDADNSVQSVEEPAALVQPLIADVEEPASPKPEDEIPQEPEEKFRRPWGRWILTALGVLLLMVLSALGGYYYGLQGGGLTTVAPDTVVVKDTVVVHDSIQAAPLDSVAVTKPKTEEPVMAEPQKDEPAVADPKKQAPDATATVDKYAQKDARVRLGAYRIVGLDHEVKVLAGQTFYSICRAHLGPDMECYVEVFNDLPQNPKVKEGQVIKIPKLQLKKRRR